jgi:hypothetical protein
MALGHGKSLARATQSYPSFYSNGCVKLLLRHGLTPGVPEDTQPIYNHLKSQGTYKR